MKQKAFTLIELLGVIVILGLLALIIYPVVNNVIQNNKGKLYNENISRIEKVAYNWSLENDNLLSKDEDYTLTLAQLKQGGYLKDEEIKNVKTGEALTGHINIHWKDESSQFEFKYVE